MMKSTRTLRPSISKFDSLLERSCAWVGLIRKRDTTKKTSSLGSDAASPEPNKIKVLRKTSGSNPLLLVGTRVRLSNNANHSDIVLDLYGCPIGQRHLL